MSKCSVTEQIREARRRAGRRLVVRDDDPTGSQSVHNVQVVLTPERNQIAAALVESGSTCFVLTNSRSMPQAEAVVLTDRITADVLAIAAAPEAETRMVRVRTAAPRGRSSDDDGVLGMVPAYALRRLADTGGYVHVHDFVGKGDVLEATLQAASGLIAEQQVGVSRASAFQLVPRTDRAR